MDFLSPADLKLPFERWREHQAETITHLAASPKKFKELQAPTGAGKSGIAVGLARITAARRTVILCSTKQLQEQYLQSFSELRMVRGRANFPCLIQEGTAEEAPCTLFGPTECPKHYSCPYYLQLWAGLSAEISVHNYSYWMLVANGAGYFGNNVEQGPLDLLICDEAHELENQLRKQVQVELTDYTFRRFNLSIPGFKDEGEHGLWRSWAEATIEDLRPEARTSDGETGEEDEGWSGGLGMGEIRRIQAARNLMDKLRIIVRMDDDWLIERGRVLSFKPVWVSEYARPKIFDHAKSVVLMSATVLDAEQFSSGLGLSPEEVDFFDMPSTFPKERRPIIFRPITKVSHGMSNEQVRMLVAAVDKVLEDHPGEKGLIHTSNYSLAQTLQGMSQYAGRLLTHQTADRALVLERFKSSDQPLVLVSPSMNEGVDLPFDECRFIVVLKLPFANKMDKQVARRMKVGPDGEPNVKGDQWYIWTTACKLVQSVGRGMRSADDYCEVVILDANFRWFRHAAKVKVRLPDGSWVERPMWPTWFLEAIREENDVSFMVRQAMKQLRDE